MAVITRGYSFSPTEDVTAAKLDALVRNADVRGLSWSEYQGSLVSISVYSAPASPVTGWITASYELFPLGHSMYSDSQLSEFNYLVETGFGPVALFKAGGFETRRFINNFGTYMQGGALFPETDATARVTLAFDLVSGNNTYGDPRFLGVNSHTTSITSQTSPTIRPRIIIRGLAPCRSSAPLQGVTHPSRFFLCPVSADGSMGCTCSTDIDKIVGIEMDNDGANVVRPGFLFGAPIWRV